MPRFPELYEFKGRFSRQAIRRAFFCAAEVLAEGPLEFKLSFEREPQDCDAGYPRWEARWEAPRAALSERMVGEPPSPDPRDPSGFDVTLRLDVCGVSGRLVRQAVVELRVQGVTLVATSLGPLTIDGSWLGVRTYDAVHAALYAALEQEPHFADRTRNGTIVASVIQNALDCGDYTGAEQLIERAQARDDLTQWVRRQLAKLRRELQHKRSS